MNLTEHSPYSASRLDLFATEVMKVSKTSAKDYLLVEPYSIGDAVHTLSLVNAFRNKHCTENQKINFLCSLRSLPIVKIFKNTDYAIGANLGPHEYQLEALAERYGPIPIGRPIPMPPDMYARGWFGRLSAAGIINALDAKKLILELDLNTVPFIPELDLNTKRDMEKKARNIGLTNDSIIIFNHANTMQEVNPEIFKPLKKIWGDRIFYDATVEGKGIIEWAKPLKMTIEEVPYFVNFAGTAVCIRSGITDLLACAAVNLITIYPNQSMLFDWSGDKKKMMNTFKNLTLNSLGIGSRSKEFPIFCDDEDDVNLISDKIKNLLESENLFLRRNNG